MSFEAIIRRKRDGGELSAEEIAAVAEGAASGSVPDYQLAAWLMAVYHRGMSPEETAALTVAMTATGDRLNLRSIQQPKVDKHSTGGVGDKVSLLLAPIVAACGSAVPMISGRGLGHTGGTVDKLESIPGFRTDLSLERVAEQVGEIGCAMAAPGERLAPADRTLYALRDVTATVESLPLLTASILSKKFAEDLDALVMDVKCGRGAFLPSLEDARALATSIYNVCTLNGLRCRAILTRMDAPLGYAVGNRNEVREVVAMLRDGTRPPLITEVALLLCGACLVAAGLAPDDPTGVAMAEAALADGSAWRCFVAMVEAQGGDIDALLAIEPPSPDISVASERSGYVREIDALEIGRLSVAIGAGRQTAEEGINPEAGILLRRHVGERVERGDVLCEIVVRRAGVRVDVDRVRGHFTVGDTPPDVFPTVVEEIG